MALTTHVASFDSHSAAAQAVRDLEAAGFSHDEVSLLAGNTASDGVSTDTAEAAESGAGVGATVGTMLGGGAGLLAGIGALAIPGLGPIVAAGWLVAAITGAGAGAAAGGLLGGLVGSGVPETEAHVHAENVRRGGTMVTVRADETRIAQARAILDRHTPLDMAARERDYRAGGWTGYSDDAIIPDSPDGTPGNPKGTMLSRGIDDVAGTNISGARPGNEVRNAAGAAAYDTGIAPGDQGRPGTAASRALDDVAGTNVSGARPMNDVRNATTAAAYDTGAAPGDQGKPGTMLSRGIDQVAGTNISGAHPENELGRTAGSATRETGLAPGDQGRPGTAASRAVDDVAGTNISGARPMNDLGASRSGQLSPRTDDDGKIIPDQPDGAPGNPKGTELSRGIDEVAGTNISGAHPENERKR